MTGRSTRKNLFALAALLGIGAGVAGWQGRQFPGLCPWLYYNFPSGYLRQILIGP